MGEKKRKFSLFQKDKMGDANEQIGRMGNAINQLMAQVQQLLQQRQEQLEQQQPQAAQQERRPRLPQPATYDGSVRPEDWLFLMAQFLEADGVEEEDQVARAALYFRGAALTWWRGVSADVARGVRDQPDFENLSRELVAQFGPVEDAQEARVAMDLLTQSGSVASYNTDFRVLALPHVAHMEVNAAWRPQQRPRQQQGGRQGKCYRCGSLEHYVAECLFP